MFGIVERLVVGRQHADVGVHRLGTGLVRVHEPHHRRDVLAPADDTDHVALAQRRRQRAGEVAALVLAEQRADVVVGILGLELVDADELDLGVGLRRGSACRCTSSEPLVMTTSGSDSSEVAMLVA